jgi:hypothetical protein
MRVRRKVVGGAAAVLLMASAVGAGPVVAKTPTTTVDKVGWKNASAYNAVWSAPYGPGEGSTSFANNAITVNAAPFTTGADSSVFDHLKYIRVSNQSFSVPTSGSLEFSVDIDAQTPGTQPGRVIHGCYGPGGSYTSISAPCAQPYAQPTIEGQQAGVVLNMINFQTGQLFDWFVSSGHVFALIERLPSTVTGSPGVGLDKAYTQIIKEAPVKGHKHNVSIRYTRGPGVSSVDYSLDNQPFAHADHVGVPLDKQGVSYTGTYPSLGAGEQLNLDSFVIGHGLFSLLDAFPFQHPDRPDLSVSIPISERLFGQGAIGTFKDFTVTTKT